MLNKEIPFLRIGLPLCAGIITGLYFNPDITFLILALLFILAGFCISLFFNKYRSNYVYGLTFTASLYLIGLVLYTAEKRSIPYLKHESSQFICTLSDFVLEKEKTTRLEVKLNKMKSGNGFIPVKGSMILYSKKDTALFTMVPGDILAVNCTPLEITNRGNPDEFDYKLYMQNQGIRYYAFTQIDDIIRTGKSNKKLTHRALIVRKEIIDMYESRGIKGDTLAIVAAVTLGQKNLLDPDQKQDFIKAGVMHIMAVSGLHAVILSLFVFKMLFFIGGRFNIIRIVITILILWAFAFVTGLTPSVLRATLMFSFIQAGMLMKRPVNSINSVLASAFVLILIRPSVIFDAGFQLSYSAVIFIISFYQILYSKLLFKNWLADKVWQSTAISIVAQAGTLSLTIMLFNRFPVWFVLSNIVIIPLSSLIIIIGCFVPLVFPVIFLSRFLATILGILTGITETLTQIVADLPLSTIDNIGLTGIESILLILTLWLIFTYVLNKESFSVIIPVTSLLLLVIAGSANTFLNSTSKELIVYNTNGSSPVGIRSGNVLNIYSDSIDLNKEVLKHSDTRGLRVKMDRKDIIPRKIDAGKKRILICNTLSINDLHHSKPDIIVFVGLHPQISRSLKSVHPATKIIISPEVSATFSFPDRLINNDIDTIHFVRKSGAYISRF